jgi:hypothetical protein
MVKDQDLIHVFGGDDDTVWFGALGSTLPTTLAAPDAAFDDAGFLGEDGMSLTRDADIAELRVHQGGKIVRKKVTSSKKDITVRLVEDNDTVKGIVDNVKSSTVATGVTTEVISGAIVVWVGAMVVDLYDTDYMERYVCSRVEVSVSGEEGWTNSALREREAVATIIGDYTRISGPIPA